jgi:aminoglycoside/choline kinase family phosphotransferase
LTELVASAVPGRRPIGVARQPVNLLSTSSVIYAVAVDRGPGEPAQRLILKVARSVDERHRREVAFYRDVAHRAGTLVPACYAAEADDGYLLLEDCRSGRSAYGMDTTPLAAVGLMVRSLAKLHAAFWAQVSGDPSSGWTDARADGDSDLLGPVRSEWSDSLSRADRSTIERAFAGRRALGTWFSPARTLCHGDYHPHNVLVGDEVRPTVTLDWQDAHAGNPGADLALFLAAYLHPRDRRAADWVAIYLHELQVAGVTGYPDEALRRDVRLGTAFALLAILRLVRVAGLDRLGALLRLKHVLTALDEAGDVDQ